MNLYDQLRQLQHLTNSFEEWALYRQKLTRYLISQIAPESHIAIVGAGRCNDLDLAQLVAHVKSITLIDKDTRGMKEGVARYQLEKSTRITLLEADVLGITDIQYRQYADKLIQEVRKKGYQTDLCTLSDLASHFIDTLINPIQSIPLNLGMNQYDTVIAVGLHSQLLSMLEWIWHVILQTINQEEQAVRKKIIHLTPSIIERLNDALLQASKSQLIIGCEKERIGRPGTIQGAIQCLTDLERRCLISEITLGQFTDLEWPFNMSQGITYNMYIASYNKSTC